MILYAVDGLQSPYSRIIFFLSVGDIIFSIAFLLGPHLLPTDAPSAIWAKGNINSCDAVGFLAHCGFAVNQLYTVALSFYFMKRVKDKVKPGDFAKRYEKVMHGIIWVVALVPYCFALARGDFNPVETGDFCAMFDNPIDCSINDEIECIRGENANSDALFTTAATILTAFILIVSNFARLTYHVYGAEKMMRLEKAAQSNNGYVDNYSFCGEIMKYFCGCCFRTRKESEEEKKESRSLTFESFVQSGLYISVFIMVYIPPIIVFGSKAMGMTRPDWLFWLPSIATPLGGALNILVYTRPKIQKVKRTFPEIADEPYVILLLVVIFSGGECPKEIDIYSSEDMVNGDSQAQSGEMKNFADNSAYERGVKQLLGEDIISNDSLLRHFYAANPVTRTKRKIQKISSNEGLSNGPEKVLILAYPMV